MKIIKAGTKYIVIALITLLLCIGLFLLVNLIPRSAIISNMQESATYFDEHPLFPWEIENRPFSKADNYADCILTQIIYQSDEKHPVRSMILASYYQGENENVDKAFVRTLAEGTEPNINYFRYWHGSQIILRPLFCIFSIRGVRLSLFIVTTILFILSSILCFRKGQKVFAVSIWVALLLVQYWMAVFSLEYLTCFLLLSIQLLWLTSQGKEKRKNRMVPFFLVSGMLTSFMDFLTTETLTITIPLLYILSTDSLPERNFKNGFKTVGKAILAWGIGYGGMFLAKWGLAYAFLGKDAFMEAWQQAVYRISGAVTADNTAEGSIVSLGAQLFGCIWRNLYCMFALPTEVKASTVMVLWGILLFLLFSFWYLFRKEGATDGQKVWLLLIGGIPFIRFLLLRNHAYMHYFFTYRALAATLLAMILFLSQTVEVRKKKRKR
ncbi:MAG: hypothetical protein MJ105_02620 [Lachnospiraceae bacterium]|nr:hypothetical protein [Lachnospiraceae bacterium]